MVISKIEIYDNGEESVGRHWWAAAACGQKPKLASPRYAIHYVGTKFISYSPHFPHFPFFPLRHRFRPAYRQTVNRPHQHKIMKLRLVWPASCQPEIPANMHPDRPQKSTLGLSRGIYIDLNASQDWKFAFCSTKELKFNISHSALLLNRQFCLPTTQVRETIQVCNVMAELYGLTELKFITLIGGMRLRLLHAWLEIQRSPNEKNWCKGTKESGRGRECD